MRGNFVNNYFGFNKQQRNGLLVLVSVSFVLLLIRIGYPYFLSPDKNISVKNLAVYENHLDSLSSEKGKRILPNNNTTESGGTVRFFSFDPNRVSFQQLLQLGFKEKTAGVFLKFRAKGFVFERKEDLKKVYGITDDFYNQLEPYIIIENTAAHEIGRNAETRVLPAPEKVSNLNVELNAADSTTLLSLPGIGSAFSKRIIKYRNLLGGFVETQQLKEVYGFTTELFEKVNPHVYVNATALKKIDLNKDDFKTINSHPYLSYEQTKAIFEWRRKTLITPSNLKEILNDPLLYSKLLPYLAFEDKN